MIQWRAYPHQKRLFRDVKSPELALVSGYGGGKTWAAARKLVLNTILNPPEVPSMYVLPTWRMVDRVALPIFRDLFEQGGIPYEVLKSGSLITFGERAWTIWLASAERPENLKGSTIGSAVQDEPAIQEEEAYRQVSFRLRHPAARALQHIMVGTHEGLGWFYHLTERLRTTGALIQSTTFDNKSTPEAFHKKAQELKERDPGRYRMYVLGIATALSGSIYTQLRPNHLVTAAAVGANAMRGRIVTGWDFNVGHMVTVVGTLFPGPRVHFWGEVVTKGGTTTDRHAQRVVEYLVAHGAALKDLGRDQWGQATEGLLGQHDREPVEAFMDAAGGQRHPSATRTDEAHVKAQGFRVKRPRRNPLVRDRIATVQWWLTNNLVSFDTGGCPFLVRAIREHSYVEGSDPPTPRKEWGENDQPHDHYSDAAGYLLCGIESVTSSGARGFGV